MPLVIRTLVHATPDYAAAIALRRAILRTPLGLDFTPGQLSAEASDIHLAGFDEDALIATVVLTPYDATTFKLRQMAVAETHQGRAIGAEMLMTAETTARARGAKRILLAARMSAAGFYSRHGYQIQGEPYIEVTLPHITMWKDL